MRFSLESSRDLQDLIKKLSVGLRNLDFEENMQCFKVSAEIKANSTLMLVNKLTFIPSQYIITSQNKSGQITRSDDYGHTWTRDKLFLENHGGNDIEFTVLFFK